MYDAHTYWYFILLRPLLLILKYVGGDSFIIKRNFHFGDSVILQLRYLHSVISDTGKTSWYWNSYLVYDMFPTWFPIIQVERLQFDQDQQRVHLQGMLAQAEAQSRRAVEEAEEKVRTGGGNNQILKSLLPHNQSRRPSH